MPDVTPPQAASQPPKPRSSRIMPCLLNSLLRSRSRILNPRNWSLKGRFLYLPGFLLFVGSIILVIIFSYSQNLTLEESVHDRLTIYDRMLRERLDAQTDALYAQIFTLSSMREVIEAMATKDREKLKNFILPFLERMRVYSGMNTLYLHFHLPPAISFLRTWNLDKHDEDMSKTRQMVVKVNNGLSPLKGIEIGAGGPVLRAITTITDKDRHLGSLESAISIEEVMQQVAPPAGFGATLIIDAKFKDVISNGSTAQRAQIGHWLLFKSYGTTNTPQVLNILSSGTIPDHVDKIFYRFAPLEDFQGKPIGGLLISYDATDHYLPNKDRLVIFMLMYFAGAAAIFFALYLNVNRIKEFLTRFRRILVATNSGDFSERFETEPEHCLDVLNCSKTECPVHQNPSLVCYLETGSEAISPAWRNTCVFLHRYEKCANCPVYAIRHGDELVEARNAVNTMTRLWGVFLNRVSTLLADVLMRRDQGTPRLPSLEEISTYLEHVAGLTSFAHGLQGVYDKAEVYRQLAFIFESKFGLHRFAFLEINEDENRMEPALEVGNCAALIAHETGNDTSLCRAKRVAEDVCSADNPAVCPYFNIDHATDVRCCLPVVMGGNVGAIFTFVMPRSLWQTSRDNVNIARKYLSESAPVLSSLRLLQASRDLALIDPLTQCHNRRYLDEYIAQFEHTAKREDKRVAFLMADLDFFKKVNDEYGHQAGDQVLKDAALTIRNSIRRADLVVRYGGEEFLILLHEVKDNSAVDVAEKIRQAVEHHTFILPDGERIQKTISLGVAEYPGDTDMLYKTIKFADVALYEAKRAGRNRVARFHPDMWSEEEY